MPLGRLQFQTAIHPTARFPYAHSPRQPNAIWIPENHHSTSRPRLLTHSCGSGGIGRHAGFRYLCLRTCGFKSRLSHSPRLSQFLGNSDGFLAKGPIFVHLIHVESRRILNCSQLIVLNPYVIAPLNFRANLHDQIPVASADGDGSRSADSQCKNRR